MLGMFVIGGRGVLRGLRRGGRRGEGGEVEEFEGGGREGG